MKDYKRLTEKGEPYYGFEKCKTCEYGKDGCDKWCDQITGCFCRLQELEDKIESGELCDRKEIAREIFDHIREYAIKDNCIIWRVYFSDLEEIAKQFGVEDEE